MRPMAKETNIKTDKKTVGGWGAWELLSFFLSFLAAFGIVFLIFPHS
jgi:hypothetical protein